MAGFCPSVPTTRNLGLLLIPLEYNKDSRLSRWQYQYVVNATIIITILHEDGNLPNVASTSLDVALAVQHITTQP